MIWARKYLDLCLTGKSMDELDAGINARLARATFARPQHVTILICVLVSTVSTMKRDERRGLIKWTQKHSQLSFTVSNCKEKYVQQKKKVHQLFMIKIQSHLLAYFMVCNLINRESGWKAREKERGDSRFADCYIIIMIVFMHTLNVCLFVCAWWCRRRNKVKLSNVANGWLTLNEWKKNTRWRVMMNNWNVFLVKMLISFWSSFVGEKKRRNVFFFSSF